MIDPEKMFTIKDWELGEKSIKTCCHVCGNETHKVGEEDNKIKFYCPTCDENYLIEQAPLITFDIKPGWNDFTNND